MRFISCLTVKLVLAKEFIRLYDLILIEIISGNRLVW